jgi:hypothetical protein
MTLATVQEIGARLNIGHHLERARLRRFVGRAAELELFANRLEVATDPAPGISDGTNPFSVLWIYGPGGIGKSTILGAYAETARNARFRVVQVDGSWVCPTPAGIQDAISEFLIINTDEPSVIMIDSAERLAPVEDWLREEFLPTLPLETVVVIAGRRPPSERWLSDPGWHQLLRTVSLHNLAPAAVGSLLDVEQLPRTLLNQVMTLTHGHPLAVSLLIDAARRSGLDLPATLQDRPDLVTALVRRLIDEAPSGQHRAALQVSAHAPITTEPVLRAGLPESDAEEIFELWEWLLDLSFVEETPDGLRPHEVARDVLEADLRWRDPDAYAEVHRRLRCHLVDNVLAQRGNPDHLQHAAAELLFLVRDHPLLGSYWDWGGLGEGLREPVEPEQTDLVVAMTQATQGEQQAELAAHWLRAQPEAFRLFRTPDGEVVGYAACLALHRAQPADIAADPGAAALWRYAQQHRPPRPGEQVLAWRFHVDHDPVESHPRASGTILGAWHIADMLLRPRTAWEFDASYTDLAYWEPFLNHWDFVHVPEADYQIGDTRYLAFAHDWRRVGIADWLERTAARELGEQVSSPPVEPSALLGQQEFAAAVKQALRDLHQPFALVRNPLLASAMVQQQLGQRTDQRADQILRSLILQAAQSLKLDPRAAAYFRVIDRTYLRPAPSQEKAAELLDLPFSTYRRHRNRGIEGIADWLWNQELDSPAQSA